MDAPRKYKIDSLCVFILGALFYIFFMHAKHDPALSKANAFADDPCDAVGSSKQQPFWLVTPSWGNHWASFADALDSEILPADCSPACGQSEGFFHNTQSR